jgi:hypothetical protein
MEIKNTLLSPFPLIFPLQKGNGPNRGLEKYSKKYPPNRSNPGKREE